jgi:adenylylsulfate kinase
MPWVIWITGLPGSGKSTITKSLKEHIPDAVMLSMDVARKTITPSPCYSDAEREYVYRSIVFTAKTLYSLGHKVIIDATGNRRKWRELSRESIEDFFEIYLKCPLKLCIEREGKRADTHGAPVRIYEKAAKGEPVPGISAPYEEPLKPDLIINTERDTPAIAVKKIKRMLDESEDRSRK